MNRASKPAWTLFVALSIPSAAAAEPMHSAQAVRADFEVLYTQLQAAHYNLFANRPKPTYDAYFRRIATSIRGPVSHRDVLLTFQRFVAYGRVAHATTGGLFDAFRRHIAAGGKRWPLAVNIENGYLSVAYAQLGITPDDQIVALGGVPTQRILDEMRAIVSADNDSLADSLLERSFTLYAWLVFGEVDHFDLEVVRGSQTRNVRVPALADSAVTALRARAPAGVDRHARKAEIRPTGIAYLQPGPFLELDREDGMFDNRDFVKFIDQSFEKFSKAKALIIDLRGNPGGDNSFSDPMVAWFATRPFAFASRFIVRSSAPARDSNQARLDSTPQLRSGLSGTMAKKYAETPEGKTFELKIPTKAPRAGARFTGPVYVIVDRHSYSNAVNVAAIVKDYGFATVVGEPTRDFATTYGAAESFKLPRTGITIYFPKAHIVRPNGSMTPAGVTPDVTIETAPATTQRDPTLEKVERLIQAKMNAR